MAEERHELIIIGGGPAGLSAAIYASRALLDAVTFEQGGFGGQATLTDKIDNYPGVPDVSGFELTDAMQKQAEALGAKFAYDQIMSIERIDPAQNDGYRFRLTDSGDNAWYAQAVILAAGARPRHAGFEGEETFGGHGVSYCATCDAMFYRNKRVYVIGGGNTACQEAVYLTNFASEVIQVVRKDHVRANASVAKALENSSVKMSYLTSVTKLEGDQLPTAITLRNNETGEETTETFDAGSFGVFVFVGTDPINELVANGLVELSAGGAVVTDETMATKTEGLFVAGDVRETPLRQVITAASDGAIAATFAGKLIRGSME